MCVSHCPGAGEWVCVDVYPNGTSYSSYQDPNVTAGNGNTPATTTATVAASPGGDGCLRGHWQIVTMDYVSTFAACLPATTQRFENASTAADPMSIQSQAQKAALNASVVGVDTVERLVSNLLADVFTARYVLVVGIIISTLVAYALLMLLEKNAFRFNAAVLTGAFCVAGFLAMALSAATFVSLDTFDFVVINNLDKRLTTAALVTLNPKP
jgi:hypothetical protein